MAKVSTGYRLVHSCTSTSWSGLERYVVELAVQHKKLGLKPVVFCREASEIHKAAVSAQVDVWCIGAHSMPGPSLWWRMRQFYAGLRGAVGAVGDAGEKIVLHMHHAGELKFHRPWLGNPRVKSILQFHLWITHKKQNPYHRWLYAPLTQVWCSTATAKESLGRLLPVAAHRINVIPYGRDVQGLSVVQKERTKERAAVASELGLKEGDVLAICVSRIETIKGVEELVRAFAQMAVGCPQAHMLIVGGVSPGNTEAAAYNQKLVEFVAGLRADVRRRLHMPGPKAGVERIIAAGDFYVLPSYEECVSLALLDAVILGLPAVGTNSGGTPSVVVDGVNGLLVPPRDAQALAVALGQLFNDGALRQRFAAGNSGMGATYDQSKVLELMVRSYGSI